MTNSLPKNSGLTRRDLSDHLDSEPITEQLVSNSLHQFGMADENLAEQVNVSQVTSKKDNQDEKIITDEDDASPPRFIHSSLGNVLDFDSIQRLRLLNIEVTGNLELEGFERLIDSALEKWSLELVKDHSPFPIIVKAQRLSAVLKRLPYSAHDKHLARMRIQTGMFLAALQEIALPWPESRDKAALRTYNELLEEVIYVVGPHQFPEEFATLLVRRAVLLREAGQADLSEVQLRHIDRLLPDIQDPMVLAARWGQELQTLAVQGRIEERYARLDQIKGLVEALPVTGENKAALRAMIIYAEGVGYKRLMWELRNERGEPSSRKRQAYAEQCVHLLESLQASPEGIRAVHNINLYHASIPTEHAAPELAVSEIDALVWSDPEGALQQAQALRAQAPLLYPSLASKLDKQIQLIQSRLGKPKH